MTEANDSHLHESWLSHLVHHGLIRPRQRRVRLVHMMAAIVVAGIAAVIVLTLMLIGHNEDQRRDALVQGQADARGAAASVSSQLREIVGVATVIADDLTAGDLIRDVVAGVPATADDLTDRDPPLKFIDGRLRGDLIYHPGFWGVGGLLRARDRRPGRANLLPLLDPARRRDYRFGRGLRLHA